MVFFGIGEVTGSIILGFIIDRLGVKKTIVINLLIIVCMTTISFLSVHSYEYNYVSTLMCFAWGFQDGAMNIHIFKLLAFNFVSQSEPFSVFNLL